MTATSTHTAGERAAGRWAPLADWHRATGQVLLSATPASLLVLLDEERPAGTAARWLTGITALHAAAGHPTPCRHVVSA